VESTTPDGTRVSGIAAARLLGLIAGAAEW
jgi:hypothetical protein